MSLRIEREGVELAGIERGEGFPVVLLHGFQQSAQREWVRTGLLAAAVAARRRAIAVDARGHGDSDKPTDPAAYGERAMAWDVVAWADALGLERYDVAGYSMGAATAVEVAFVDRRVRRLLLGGIGEDGTSTEAYRQQAAFVADGDARAWFDPDACGADRAACAAWLAGAVLPQLADLDLGRIGRVTVVNGEDDHDVAFADRFAGGTGVTVPGDHGAALHTPEFREQLAAWCREGA